MPLTVWPLVFVPHFVEDRFQTLSNLKNLCDGEEIFDVSIVLMTKSFVEQLQRIATTG